MLSRDTKLLCKKHQCQLYNVSTQIQHKLDVWPADNSCSRVSFVVIISVIIVRLNSGLQQLALVNSSNRSTFKIIQQNAVVSSVCHHQVVGLGHRQSQRLRRRRRQPTAPSPPPVVDWRRQGELGDELRGHAWLLQLVNRHHLQASYTDM